jgi:flagellar biosynthesis protein FlhA
MPGKQMAIDADLNSGLIDEDEARRRRKEVAAEADFYGAMDGGTKFVKGDAVAAVIITLVNLVGGFAVGMLQKGMEPGDAINTYALLSVGDGLVSQIPALLMSVATGVIVTRATSDGDVGNDLVGQLTRHREALRIGGGALIALCVVPGMPKLPFIVAGGLLLLASTRSPAPDQLPDADRPAQALPAGAPAEPERDPVTESLHVDPLELLLAPDVVDLVDSARGGDLLDRVRALRRKTALDLGIVLPPVRTRDGATLGPGGYEIRIGGVSVATGEAPPGHLLAIGDAPEMLPGRRTTEPVFGLPAVWVPLEHRTTAEAVGATLVERAAVVTTHLAEMVRRHASRLLSLDDVKQLLDVLKAERPTAVEEVVPALLPLSGVQRVLQGLLDEQVSVRDLGRVLEGLGACLGPALTAPYQRDGVLHAITLEPAVESELAEGLRASEQGVVLAVDPIFANQLVGQLSSVVTAAENTGVTPVLLVAGPLRLPLRRLLRGTFPQLPVLGFAETAGLTAIETVGQVSRGHDLAARG